MLFVSYCFFEKRDHRIGSSAALLRFAAATTATAVLLEEHQHKSSSGSIGIGSSS